MRATLLLLLVAAAAAGVAVVGGAPTPGKQPNFVVLLVDDLGYGDISRFGGDDGRNISTPNINRLADEGLSLTQWIAPASMCTPARAAMQTGRFAVRSGMASTPVRILLDGSQPGGLPQSEWTVAEALKEQGYRTATSGKHHLGLGNYRDRNAHMPTRMGFDTYYGFPHTNLPDCEQGNEDPMRCYLFHDEEVVQQPMRMQNLTLQFTQHATDYIAEAAASGEPFFYLLSYLHVHTALFSSPWFEGRSGGGPFGDNVEEMDWSVGRVMEALREHGVADDTVVLFLSDQGPALEEADHAGTTGGLKGGKGQTYEGGIRVPAIAWGPGVGVPANHSVDTLVSTVDVMPTLVALAGGELPRDRLYDGKDISGVLLAPADGGAEPASPHEFYMHYCGTIVSAARHGNIKVHWRTANWTSTYMEDAPCEECCPFDPEVGIGLCMCDDPASIIYPDHAPLMYDMASDPRERHPLTPDNFPDYHREAALLRDARDAHVASVVEVRNQIHTLPNSKLKPCCNPPSCECDNPLPFTPPALERRSDL